MMEVRWEEGKGREGALLLCNDLIYCTISLDHYATHNLAPMDGWPFRPPRKAFEPSNLDNTINYALIVERRSYVENVYES